MHYSQFQMNKLQFTLMVVQEEAGVRLFWHNPAEGPKCFWYGLNHSLVAEESI